jgi:plastocyanin
MKSLLPKGWWLAATLVIGIQASLASTVTITAQDKNGTPAADTIVVLDPVDAKPPAGHATAVIDQIDKTFVPHVTVIRTGTAVSFPNSDQIRHQVYSFSAAKTFSIKLYAGSPRVDVVFDKPGLVVLGCNIHDSMVGFVAVVDSPYFTTVRKSGTVSLEVPPGKYRVRIWNPHMKAPPPPLQVQITTDKLDMPVSVELDPAGDTTADWPE